MCMCADASVHTYMDARAQPRVPVLKNHSSWFLSSPIQITWWKPMKPSGFLPSQLGGPNSSQMLAYKV